MTGVKGEDSNGNQTLTLRSFWSTFSLGNTSPKTISLKGVSPSTIGSCHSWDSPIILRDIRARANYYKLYQKASESLTKEEARPSPSDRVDHDQQSCIVLQRLELFQLLRKSSVAVF